MSDEEIRKQLDVKRLKYLDENREIIMSDAEIQESLNSTHEKLVRDKISKSINAQTKPTIPNRKSNDPIAIQDVINLFNMFEMYNTEKYKGGNPLPPDDERQKRNWENQTLSPTRRTILIEIPDGSIIQSQSYSKLKVEGITAEQRVENKKIYAAKHSEKNYGRKALNEVEAIAISLLIKLINEYNTNYIFSTVFDGLKADLMIRNNEWPINEWVAIQMKSANIKFGKPTRYTIKDGKYDNIYCICIGLLYYDENIKPKDCNDTTNIAKIFEIFDVGKACAINTSPGLKSHKPTNRLYMLHERIEKKEDERRIFIENMLSNIEKFPKFTKEHILFDIGFNCMNSSKTKITEMKGIETIYKLLERYGMSLTAPNRQNETVDYVIEYNKKRICVSQKTASIVKRTTGRGFDLSVAPNSQFVDIIIAICPATYNKISLINSEIYSDKSKRFFGWSERSMEKKGVREFDISTEKGAMDFIKALFPEYVEI
jgi:hypothetical protein